MSKKKVQVPDFYEKIWAMETVADLYGYSVICTLLYSAPGFSEMDKISDEILEKIQPLMPNEKDLKWEERLDSRLSALTTQANRAGFNAGYQMGFQKGLNMMVKQGRVDEPKAEEIAATGAGLL